MNLHDPNRPRILHRPAFLSGWHVIPRLQIWPKENGKMELSLMLPIPDQRFAGKWYSLECYSTELQDLTKEFQQDPEEFVLSYFDLDITKLNHSAPAISGEPTERRQTKSNPVLSVAELLASEE